jgi:hypothetical protein
MPFDLNHSASFCLICVRTHADNVSSRRLCNAMIDAMHPRSSVIQTAFDRKAGWYSGEAGRLFCRMTPPGEASEPERFLSRSQSAPGAFCR